jgi:hypothetical protein
MEPHINQDHKVTHNRLMQDYFIQWRIQEGSKRGATKLRLKIFY